MKRDLLIALGNKRFLQKKIIKQIRSKITLEREKQEEVDAKKVSRYQSLQAKIELDVSESKFSIPASISQYAGIKAFNKPNIPVVEPEKPVVYCDKIKLTEDEMAILNKGPKFAVRQQSMRETSKLS